MISISGAARWRVTCGRELIVTRSPAGRRVSSAGGLRVLTLEGETPVLLNQDLLATLVLACWLILQWEMLPRGGQSVASNPIWC